jgi:hypothetical protein
MERITMERVPFDIEVYNMDICKEVAHEKCPGISVLYAREQELVQSPASPIAIRRRAVIAFTPARTEI